MVLSEEATFNYNLSSLATISANSSSPTHILFQNANQILTQNGAEQNKIRDIVQELVCNLRCIKPLSANPRELISVQMKNITTGGCPKIKLESVSLRPRPQWMLFMEKVPCLLASKMGNAIITKRSAIPNAGCNYLPAEQNCHTMAIHILNLVSTELVHVRWIILGRQQWCFHCWVCLDEIKRAEKSKSWIVVSSSKTVE